MGLTGDGGTVVVTLYNNSGDGVVVVMKGVGGLSLN